MPDNPRPDSSPAEPPEAAPDQARWDPQQVMRDRAAADRKQRDASIASLREAMDDDTILDEFGINLDEIES